MKGVTMYHLSILTEVLYAFYRRNNKALKNGEYDDKLTYLYSCDKNDVKKYSDRYIDVINGFEETFGKDGDIALFSAPGRTEIGGNHTDHQHGCVLAGVLILMLYLQHDQRHEYCSIFNQETIRLM